MADGVNLGWTEREVGDAEFGGGSAQSDRASEAWPTPDRSLAARDAVPPPVWPGDLFPGDWREFVEDASEARGCPPDFIGMGLLAAVATRIGNARWGSPWPGWTEPPALWCAAVGLPSSGKSGGLDEAADALTEIETSGNADWEERQRQYRTTRLEAREWRDRWEAEVKAAVKDNRPPPQEPDSAREPDVLARRRVMTTDPTTAKAERLAAENPRGLLLLRDELAGWIGGMDRFGGGRGADRAFWLQAYGGRRWLPDRVKDGAVGVDVPHLTWGILGAIQPDRVASLLMAGDDDGLTARFLYAWPAPRKPARPRKPPPTGYLAAALQKLEELPWSSPEPVILRFTPKAAEMLQEWREEVATLEAEASGLFLSWLGKLPGFAVRLGVVFAHLSALSALSTSAWKAPAEVDADALARACAFLADYAVPMARRVFREAALPEPERDARRLARWYMLQPIPRPDILNAKALRRVANGPGIPDAARMNAALAELAEAGWCRHAGGRVGGTVGRGRADWTMHPVLREAAR